MRKVFIMSLSLFSIFLLSGCFGKGKEDVIGNFKKQLNKMDSYYLTGNLKIFNDEDHYAYDVEVSYKKDDNFRVSLKNKTNDHEQIILKNQEGVYVLTPSLNKSFKFQSEWPYNNSQSYLLQTLLADIENEDNPKIIKKDDYKIVETKVIYSNNTSLVKQKIYFDEKANIKKVEVFDKENKVKIEMQFDEIKKNSKFDDDYFNLNSNMSMTNDQSVEETSKELQDVLYPMYIPQDTYLASEDKVKTTAGERVILTFKGENPFTIVEETATASKEHEVINVAGEPTILTDVVGSVSDNYITWVSNGVEYYASSTALDETELLQVAKSVTTQALEK